MEPDENFEDAAPEVEKPDDLWDSFACFGEWASEEDEAAFADL